MTVHNHILDFLNNIGYIFDVESRSFYNIINSNRLCKSCIRSILVQYYLSKQKPAIDIQEKELILTEDTGKMFEMVICLAYTIPYDGLSNMY